MGNSLRRIKQYIDSQGINISTFEKSVGLSNGSFATQLKNNKSIGVDKLENILKTYPDLNPDWVLMGIGDMTRVLVKSSELNEPSVEFQKNQRGPRAHQNLAAWRPEGEPPNIFSELEEIEMKIISHTLADLLIHGGKQSIDRERTFRIQACRDDAYEYYTQKQANPRLQ